MTINYIFGFVYDPDVEGPTKALDPRKIQDTVILERLWAGTQDL